MSFISSLIPSIDKTVVGVPAAAIKNGLRELSAKVQTAIGNNPKAAMVIGVAASLATLALIARNYVQIVPDEENVPDTKKYTINIGGKTFATFTAEYGAEGDAVDGEPFVTFIPDSDAEGDAAAANPVASVNQ